MLDRGHNRLPAQKVPVALITPASDARGNGTKGTLPDGYIALQRKLEDLERVHAESKKAYQADLERLKQELARTQRLTAESMERAEKLKKKGEVQDARIQELKKTSLSEQAEIKDLRAKLRVSEHERAQLQSKQGEAGDAKKALHALEVKRRDEGKEKDRKIAESEKALASERRRRESAEARLAETKGVTSVEVQHAKMETQKLEKELEQVRAEAEGSKAALAVLRAQAEEAEEDLLSQLERHRVVLSLVTEQYGRLASSTVPKVEYERAKEHFMTLQLQLYRAERKSANAEGQVKQLAELIRHENEQNSLLSVQLRDTEEELAVYVSASEASRFEQKDQYPCLLQELYAVGRELRDSESRIRQSLETDCKVWNGLHVLRSRQLLLHSSFLVKHVQEAQDDAEQLDREVKAAGRKLSQISAELSTARTEHDITKTQLVEATSSLAISRATEESLRKQVETSQAEKKLELAKLQKVVKQEKEANQRLSGLIQQSRASESALNADIERLTMDLAEAEQYREAYCNMIDEVDALVRRNALAEDEARALSKFNAQILGHKNPAQRIMYVDNIRQELHETKQQLLMTTRDKEAVIDENEELRQELAMYKSVAVSADIKPRTFVTRVLRAPLTNHNAIVTSVGAMNRTNLKKSNGSERSDPIPTEYKEGDMTLDEMA